MEPLQELAQTAHGVEVLHHADEAIHAADLLSWNALGAPVLGTHKMLHLPLIAAHNRKEGAKKPDQEQRELAGFALRTHSTAADAAAISPNDLPHLRGRETQVRPRVQHRFAEDLRLIKLIYASGRPCVHAQIVAQTVHLHKTLRVTRSLLSGLDITRGNLLLKEGRRQA